VRNKYSRDAQEKTERGRQSPDLLYNFTAHASLRATSDVVWLLAQTDN